MVGQGVLYRAGIAMTTLAALSVVVSGCGDTGSDAVVTTTQSAATSTSAHPSTTASTAVTSSTTTSTTKADNGVAAVAKKFASIAPPSLFKKFDSCSPNGLEGSMECSGPEVGQFQFFDSESKAASTAQLLTELRSSRVVVDTGTHIVGWTTLGNNAVVTAVDTHKALVMQQMISSDKVDPEERISDLGLADHVEHTAETEEATPEPEAEPSETPAATS